MGEAAIIASQNGDKICDIHQYVGVTWGHETMTTTMMTMTIRCSNDVSNGDNDDDDGDNNDNDDGDDDDDDNGRYQQA